VVSVSESFLVNVSENSSCAVTSLLTYLSVFCSGVFGLCIFVNLFVMM